MVTIRNSKFAALTTALLNCESDIVRFTFEEIDALVGLPSSAYYDRPSWANCTTSSATSFQRSWQKAGYKVSAINLSQQWVEFSKSSIAFPQRAQRHVTSVVGTSKINTNQIMASLKCGYSCFDDIDTDENHRYLSWEHCHAVFKANRHNPNEATVDYLCLHLAWYLASWGMLRNSFLMQKDYKIHAEVVKLIYQPQWDSLWDLPAEMMAQEQYAQQVIQLSQLIADAYSHKGGNPTDTLLTKILLGTIGCVPAYDRYFKKALSITGAAPQSFGVRSIVALGNLYMEYKNEFVALQKYCSKRTEYPAAKVIDMCFFEYGFQQDGRAEE